VLWPTPLLLESIGATVAERPYVAGAVAIGVVVAALHLGTAPAPFAPASSASSGGAHIRRSIQHPQNALDVVPWEAEMKNHPEDLGKLTAQKEFDDTIDDFYTPQTATAGALEMMIAIEPDPVHTHLSLLFDRDVDALEDALQASGYLYQSNWLPWAPPSSAPSTADRFIGQEEQRLFLEGRENYPGVILFRPRPLTQKPPLAVFVVGNSPTGGIDNTQFEEALSQLKSRAPRQHELRILGPTFSGSGPSLRTLLSGKGIASSGLTRITIASGPVTDPDCTHLLPRGEIDAEHRCASGGPPEMTLVSFGIDRDWRRDQIRAYLRKQGRFKPWEIAELTEDESSYGLRTERDNDGYLHFYFPRNISHLSNAYQKNNIFGFGVSSQGSSNISLSLNFGEANDDDTVPDFAEQQMPVSQDGVMHEITQTLEQREVKVVVLSATDVLDELFVAEVLARQAPNALVVIAQADNLFLRSIAPNEFADMYFVSPFPLIGPAKPGNSIFPSDASEQLYAAVRFFFPREDTPYLPDYSSPLSPTKRPPLFLSAVGHGDYWPVALLDDTDSPRRSPFHLPEVDNQVPRQESLPAELPRRSQDLLVLCLCLLALYHTAKCVGLPPLQELSVGYTINDADARMPKRLLQLGITVLLLTALQLSATPSHSPGVAKGALYAGSTALSLTAGYLICLLVVPGLDTPPPVLFARQSRKRGILISGILILSLVAGLTSWRLLWHWLSGPSHFPEFFEYRASYPLRGVSPVFPLLLSIVAFCILLYSHLDRIAFTKNFRPRLPNVVQDLPSCPGEAELLPVTNLLRWPPEIPTILGKFALFAVVAVFVCVCITPLHLRPRMFDGLTLQRSLGLAMFLLVVAILWELVMAAVVWQKLKSLCLERLESSSLRRGFSSISGMTWSSLWIFRGSRSARYRAIYRLLEQARGVLHEEASVVHGGSSLEEAIVGLEIAIACHKPQLIVEEFGRVQKQIAAVAGCLLGKLKPAWLKERCRITACDAAGDEERTGETASTKPEELIPAEQVVWEEWVALVYVHYIRMVLLQVRSRLVTAAALYLFLVWAATCYPYLNRHVLLIALAALLGLLSFAVVLIYASINRDPTLSRTTNHTPGHLDLDFYLKTASLVGIPMVGFIASQFPEVSGFLFSWLEPGMAAVR
jgi:hypothetical protein